MTGKAEVLATGPFATVQDLGRPGLAAVGVGRSGAADRASLRLANRLVGNPETHAALEVTFGGLVLRVSEATTVAVTGAEVAVRAGRRAAAPDAPITLRAGEELALGTATRGLRCYVAIRGGFDVLPVLGARATDTMGGLGPRPLAPGMTLPIGAVVADHPVVDLAPRRALEDEPVLRIAPGPRLDWFTGSALSTLVTTRYTVTADLDRIGVRLDGPALQRARAGELPPEAAVPGALQVPPSGVPILFLADHPVTGGYPVPAVVVESDVDLAAQLRPGQHVRFALHREGREQAERRQR
ncbi:biotin-dependent carboxyltransferase family protein [Amycolatopsis rhabdoformis]|uniref:Biotin-dependent carboxyltransferase family protein n=1 Tax=Amycolatopsis rhabdoformis TaxID=1448059 RepID=A0ABZ1HZ99_9PSEU|nr:biotin-dependent carboxyltransferase family protein [Amycolatopsis rhabdoformis]WSE27451.1 biotin-dependent carboxyltransferase family protein [Amycolatopsis rhabdoformis]